MNENEFDKKIGEKLKGFERTPSMHIFNKVLETRQENKKALFWNNLFNSNLFWATLAILLVSTWSFISYNPNSQTKTAFNTADPAHKQSVNQLSKNKDEKEENATNFSKESLSQDRLNENIAYTNDASRSNGSKELGKAQLVKYPIQKKISNSNSTSDLEDKKQKSIADWLEMEKEEGVYAERYDRILLSHNLRFKKISEIFNRNTDLVPNDFEKISPDKPYPSRKNPMDRRLKEIEIVGGIGTWVQSLDGMTLQGFEETNKIQSSLQIRTRFEIASNWNILAGIGFWNRNADYTVNQTWQNTFLEIDTVKGFIIDPISGPKEIIKYDTSSVTQTINRNEQGHNSYMLMSVPLALEYQKTLGRGKLYLHSGVMFNLYQRDNATWYASPNDNLQRYSGNSKQYSKSIHLSYFTGLGYTYALSPKLSWSNEIQGFLIQTQNNPIGKLEGSKIYTLGLQTGIRIRL
jgi:hypothetical protein